MPAKARCSSLCAVVTVFLLVSSAMAQKAPAPKVDIFGGYSWMRPDVTTINGISLKDVPAGWGAAITFNFTRVFGLTIDGGGHYSDFFHLSTVTAGPRLKFRAGRAAPFLEGMAGLQRLLISGVSPNNDLGVVAGGGLDISINRHLDLRLAQADYVWGRHDFTNVGAGKLNLKGVRLQTGLVLKFGGFGPPPTPMSTTCAGQPTEVFAGEPVTVAATAHDVPKKHIVTYSFNASGGKVQSTEGTATVDTTGLAPGSYKVTADVTDPKAKKAPPATCEAEFTVKELPKHPPAITCSANATSVKAGEPVTLTCTTQNPDNRPLTYNWVASGGKLAPAQTTATLDTSTAPAGPITVNTKVSDDRGLSASATTTVNVEVPPPPPQASKLSELAFRALSARVDNTAKAILDDVSLRLARDADAKAVIVGFFDPQTEQRNGATLAAQRAVNAKAYLVRDKGMDPTRIEVRTGTAGGTRAEIWLVPAGARFAAADTTPVDEAKVKPTPIRPSLYRRARRMKPAAPQR